MTSEGLPDNLRMSRALEISLEVPETACPDGKALLVPIIRLLKIYQHREWHRVACESRKIADVKPASAELNFDEVPG